MKTLKPVPKQILVLILIVDSMNFIMCLNMWTSLEQKQASNKTPIKRCVSPCRIFHTWCKNDGKCREKGPDCTWYCECPKNCEGFFCEKKVAKESAEEGQKVEVKVTVEKEKKKHVSAFDKSKLAQALAGIFMKEKQTDEEKKTVLPDTMERVGKTIEIKENVTTNMIIQCPPGELPPKAPANQGTFETTTETANLSTTQENSTQELHSIAETKVDNVTEILQNLTTKVPEQFSTITSSETQSVNTESSIRPIVSSSFSVTQSTTTRPLNDSKKSESHDQIQNFEYSTTEGSPTASHAKKIDSQFLTTSEVSTGNATSITTTTTTTQLHQNQSTSAPMQTTTIKRETTSIHSDANIPMANESAAVTAINREIKTLKTDKTINDSTKSLPPAGENSLYKKAESVVQTEALPDLLNIIEKAIEVELITTTATTTAASTSTANYQHQTTSEKKTSKEGVITEKEIGNITAKLYDTNTSAPVSEKETISTTTEINSPNIGQSVPESLNKIESIELKTVQVETAVTNSNYSSSTTVQLTDVVNSENYKNDTTRNISSDIQHPSAISENTSLISPSFRARNKTSFTNVDLFENDIQNTSLKEQISSDGTNLTVSRTKILQTADANEKSINRLDMQHPTKSTTQKVEQPTGDKKLSSVITTVSTVTPFRTKFITTTVEPVTDRAVTVTKTFSVLQNVTTDKSKNEGYLSKHTSTESTGANRSSSENIVTGDINMLSTANGQQRNLTGEIIMSHDLPQQTVRNMSTVESDVSNFSTTAQQISRSVTKNVNERNPRPLTVNILHTHEQSTPATDTLGSDEHPTTAPPSTGTTITTQRIKDVSTAKTPTTQESETEGKPFVKEIQTTAKAPQGKQPEITSVGLSTTSPKMLKTNQPKLNKNILSKQTSTKAPMTLQVVETSTEASLTTSVSTATSTAELKVLFVTVSSSMSHAGSSAPTTETVNIDTSTRNNDHTTISNTVSVQSTTMPQHDVSNSTTDTLPSLKHENNTRETSTVSFKPSEAEDTGQFSGIVVSTTEPPTKTDNSTQSHQNKGVLTTNSNGVIYSADTSAAQDSKMSIAKAILDSQSDLLKNSKVKNEILTNKLSESVKDLKFDLLKMKLQDKGPQSDLNNIL